ncbi:Predicted dithiol-disulfide isomerase, DsbA family [Limimonas halophila]|uniref:Predicted dithiol-disulfide isomerase, DsbA family n=1 Tax=Limimonas halophila TaxID=1082479 RepID=A0A1G7NJJ8_9PROT|nr:DsbA family oxidoreductase [Limimonas halophila]SDF74244.1 Predicted dithiol-disulfide isomerase, DsbA family [Limimonas halophila]
MHLDIFSDPICPWCLIGKRRLERALAERPEPELTIRWRAFQLNPDMPRAGMDRTDYVVRKFGSMDNANRVYDAVKAAAAEEGIPLALDRIQRTPNTLPAHQLIHLAGERGVQDTVVEDLFQAYFMRGEDVGEQDVLLAAARRAGMDEDVVRDALDRENALEIVQAEDQEARSAGIQGIPTFILNGEYALSGAQEPKVLHNLFDVGRTGSTEGVAAS